MLSSDSGPGSAPPTPSPWRLGVVCAVMILAFLALSAPLRCVGKAAQVGGAALASGALLGLCLAGITRTRRPGFIYTFAALALLTFWPLLAYWPPASALDLQPWPGAPPLVLSYFDALRAALFVLAVPYPYAAFGFHAPDPIAPEVGEKSAEEVFK